MQNLVRASVIIPNWNGQEFLPDCLSSLNQQLFEHFEVILVDNGSVDGSVEYVLKNYPEVRIIQLPENLGFAKAINGGVKASQADYVVFLNNDTKVDKDWLKNLVQMADKHPEVISVGSKILNFFQRDLIDGVGILINEVGQAKSLGWQEKDGGQYNKSFYIFGATGGAALFKREDFIRVGMFDESFFMYSEEVDFAFRSQFLGYKSIYAPLAKAFHKHKSSAKRKPQHIEYWQFKNMTQVIIKDFPVGILFKNWRWLKIILIHFNTIFYQLKNGFIWPPIATELWLIFNLPRLLLQRRKIQVSKKVSDSYIESFLVEKKITFWGLLR